MQLRPSMTIQPDRMDSDPVNPRPIVSEAVVDVNEEGPGRVPTPLGGPPGRSGGVYIVPIAFCLIAFGLILAAFLSGVDLSIFAP